MADLDEQEWSHDGSVHQDYASLVQSHARHMFGAMIALFGDLISKNSNEVSVLHKCLGLLEFPTRMKRICGACDKSAKYVTILIMIQLLMWNKVGISRYRGTESAPPQNASVYTFLTIFRRNSDRGTATIATSGLPSVLSGWYHGNKTVPGSSVANYDIPVSDSVECVAISEEGTFMLKSIGSEVVVEMDYLKSEPIHKKAVIKDACPDGLSLSFKGTKTRNHATSLVNHSIPDPNNPQTISEVHQIRFQVGKISFVKHWYIIAALFVLGALKLNHTDRDFSQVDPWNWGNMMKFRSFEIWPINCTLGHPSATRRSRTTRKSLSHDPLKLQRGSIRAKPVTSAVDDVYSIDAASASSCPVTELAQGSSLCIPDVLSLNITVQDSSISNPVKIFDNQDAFVMKSKYTKQRWLRQRQFHFRSRCVPISCPRASRRQGCLSNKCRELPALTIGKSSGSSIFPMGKISIGTCWHVSQGLLQPFDVTSTQRWFDVQAQDCSSCIAVDGCNWCIQEQVCVRNYTGEEGWKMLKPSHHQQFALGILGNFSSQKESIPMDWLCVMTWQTFLHLVLWRTLCFGIYVQSRSDWLVFLTFFKLRYFRSSFENFCRRNWLDPHLPKERSKGSDYGTRLSHALGKQTCFPGSFSPSGIAPCQVRYE
eukprot:751922-Hanusia_phi.AAC.3